MLHRFPRKFQPSQTRGFQLITGPHRVTRAEGMGGRLRLVPAKPQGPHGWGEGLKEPGPWCVHLAGRRGRTRYPVNTRWAPGRRCPRPGCQGVFLEGSDTGASRPAFQPRSLESFWVKRRVAAASLAGSGPGPRAGEKGHLWAGGGFPWRTRWAAWTKVPGSEDGKRVAAPAQDPEGGLPRETRLTPPLALPASTPRPRAASSAGFTRAWCTQDGVQNKTPWLGVRLGQAAQHSRTPSPPEPRCRLSAAVLQPPCLYVAALSQGTWERGQLPGSRGVPGMLSHPGLSRCPRGR